MILLLFNDLNEEVITRFNKVWIGEMLESRMSYNMQTIFETNGYFAVKVTLLGENLFLLEERDAEEIKKLVVSRKN